MSAQERFKPGDRVKVKFEDRPGHIRTPWYIRGKTGWIVESTSEQFRESGTYDQDCTCAAIPYMGPPKGVDYTKGQGERAGLTFTFYKYVGP